MNRMRELASTKDEIKSDMKEYEAKHLIEHVELLVEVAQDRSRTSCGASIGQRACALTAATAFGRVGRRWHESTVISERAVGLVEGRRHERVDEHIRRTRWLLLRVRHSWATSWG